MDHAIYTAMNAASSSLAQQAITSNNLANSSTPGFRAQIPVFRAVPITGKSLETRTLVTDSTPTNDFSEGPIDKTNRSLDVALDQDGWLAVQLPNGSEGYTRNGNLQVNADGQLLIQGHPVMSNSGPITVPIQSQITIGPDGTISALNPGDQLKDIAPIGKLKLVKAKPGQLVHGDDGLFHVKSAEGSAGVLPEDPEMKVVPGSLEGSNVSSIQSMISLINNARNFQMQMKVITDVSENAQDANQMLSLS